MTNSRPLRVVLVEDEPDHADLVERELRREGFDFVTQRVEDEEGFVAALEQAPPDVVLSDYCLPRFDGLRALEVVRERRPETPLIIVTGSQNEETAVRCLKAGAADYVIKEHLSRLGPALRSALERRRQDEERRLLLRAFGQAQVAIVITDAQARIVFANPHFEELSGYALDEVRGRNPRLLKSGLTPTSTYAELWRTVTTGATWRGEFCNRRKDGSLYWEEAVISAMRDGAGCVTHYVAVKRDVTERRHSAELLRQAELQLVQAQKMEAIGRLAGGIAHDFNNLLSVISGQGEQLQAGLDRADARRARVDQICWSARRAAELTRQLLAFGRRQVLEPRVLRMDGVLADAKALLERVIGEDVELVVRAGPSLPCVRADASQLVQILLNLAVNSRDAMPRGGRLAVELSEAVLEAPDVDAEAVQPPGRYVRIRVSDTGCGMDAATLAHIFEPFFTTKHEGTGLGLSTVYGIVKQSGGFISAQSEEGRGTVFTIDLPAVDEQAADAKEPAPRAAPRPPPGVRLLLVEDDAGVRSLVSELLERVGYDVVVAERPSEALAAAAAAPPDLLLTDVIMPEMSGRELARVLVERRPGLKVVYMSGYAGGEIDRYGGIGAGESFLQKPFGERELLDAVARSLRGDPTREA